MNKTNFFQLSKSYTLAFIIFLFPLFFLPTTQEFFVTNKMYLLAFGSLLLLAISTIEFLVSKKIKWETKSLDIPVILFVVSVILSIAIASPNKVSAILSPNFGLVSIISLAILYFYISREKNFNLLSIIYHLSSIILSLLAIVFFFQPFKIRQLADNLPPFWQFLKSADFTPLGSQLDLAIFLGFFVIIAVVNIFKKGKEVSTLHSIIYHLSSIILSFLAFFLTTYSLLKPNQSSIIYNLLSNLPPFRISWYAALEIFKNPLTAFFGAGVDNFSFLFTKLKDVAYNQSEFWQINSFSLSRSAVLQIISEIGLSGIIVFGLIIGIAIKIINSHKHQLYKDADKLKTVLFFGFIFIMLLLFPVSLPLLFLFFVTLAQLSRTDVINHASTKIDLENLIPIYLGIVAVSFLLIALSGYFLGRSYASEYYFKKSLDGISQNNIKVLYDNQRQAIVINPYIERYRTNFSQTNLLVANNIANNLASQQDKSQDKQKNQLSEQDRQTISQAIQAAIAEAKAAVTLNPQKAGNWENLANIYRNIINIVQGADTWTISAYQRAIVLDPQNPMYRLNLGGIFYSLKNYDEALSLFNQTVALKSDWANGYYNLAWAAYQKQNYQMAVNAMKNAINLLDPKASRTDVERAQKELDKFEKMLPKEASSETK